jgi:hypothetical protein
MFGVSRRSSRRSGHQTRRLQFEQLESRQLLAGDLIGTWDTDGDGTLESVYDGGTLIRIERANGRFQDYYVGPDWSLATATDTDGLCGQELVVNTTSGVKIIRDASQKTQTYYLGSTWSLIETADTNGLPGDELVFDIGNSVKIIRDASQRTQTYYMGGDWTYIGAAQLDKFSGLELQFNMGGRVVIVDEDNNSTPTISAIADHTIPFDQNPWHNFENRSDVTNDGYLSALDILILINYLNVHPVDPTLPGEWSPSSPFLDVNNDGVLTPSDVLTVLDDLNNVTAQFANSTEGEAMNFAVPIVSSIPSAPIPSVDSVPGENCVLPPFSACLSRTAHHRTVQPYPNRESTIESTSTGERMRVRKNASRVEMEPGQNSFRFHLPGLDAALSEMAETLPHSPCG